MASSKLSPLACIAFPIFEPMPTAPGINRGGALLEPIRWIILVIVERWRGAEERETARRRATSSQKEPNVSSLALSPS
jgi:hypothetical protein